jgi:hypothetical protein
MPTRRLSESQSGFNLELIRCVRQPGNLRITRHACALRYLSSRKKNPAIPRNAFEMAHQIGLEICGSCPEGRLYAEDLKS